LLDRTSYKIVLNTDSTEFGGDEHVLASSEYFTSEQPWDDRRYSIKVGLQPCVLNLMTRTHERA